MHIPVLLNEAIEYLNPQPNQNFIDCTINGGGHSLEILKRIKPDGKILGIDWDQDVLSQLEGKIGDEDKKNFVLVNDNYSNLKNIVREKVRVNFSPVNGILFDLGMSSWDIEASGRGFSFLKDEPLDMRYSRDQQLTAREIINKWPEEELANIFYKYGEERRSRAIAAKIVWERKKKSVETTTDLVEIIKKAMPVRCQFGRIHPATRVFQALRIAVNNELGNLEDGLNSALEVLVSGGRLAVISFHSLEDRMVKIFFRENTRAKKVKILTKKPVIAGEDEIAQNPRARSAKLRVAAKY